MKHEAITQQQVIETDTFTLRPLRKSDIGPIELFCGDARLAKMTTSIPHPLPPGYTETFVARAMSVQRDEDVWAIDGSKFGGAELMGLISLEKMDRNQSEVGYWIAPQFRGMGYAKLAARALIEANPLNNSAMFASVFQDNPRSAEILTGCGFTYLGDAESYCVARNCAVSTWTYLKKLDG